MKSGDLRRGNLGGDGFYLEKVIKEIGSESIQGCVAYDENHNHNPYRLDVMCCK